jgi:hypothetical protein
MLVPLGRATKQDSGSDVVRPSARAAQEGLADAAFGRIGRRLECGRDDPSRDRRAMKAHGEPVVIGWTECVDLPDWGVTGLQAKVDTGARSSALHVENIRELPRGVVLFDVVLHRKHRDRRVPVRTHVTRRSRVRSSNGQLSYRLFVETTLRLGAIEKTIELSLVDREMMIHRMLLGRAALSGPFLIDVDHRMLQSRRKRRAARRT